MEDKESEQPEKMDETFFEEEQSKISVKDQDRVVGNTAEVIPLNREESDLFTTLDKAILAKKTTM